MCVYVCIYYLFIYVCGICDLCTCKLGCIIFHPGDAKIGAEVHIGKNIWLKVYKGSCYFQWSCNTFYEYD
jgi:hypothetical protein